MSETRVVDSSGWLEYFGGSSRAVLFAEAIEDTEHLIVPVISIYEVYKKTLRERGSEKAAEVANLMRRGRVVLLDIPTVLHAGTYQLSLADSVIYAVAVQYSATL